MAAAAAAFGGAGRAAREIRGADRCAGCPVLQMRGTIDDSKVLGKPRLTVCRAGLLYEFEFLPRKRLSDVTNY